MTKAELLTLTKKQSESISLLTERVQDLEHQLQIRAAAVMLDQDSSHLVSVLKERIRILEQQRNTP